MLAWTIQARVDAGPALLPHDTRGPTLYWVMLIFLIVAGVFILLRAYVKIFLVKKLTADDWFMFAAYVSRRPLQTTSPYIG